jgi:hypothetical protein
MVIFAKHGGSENFGYGRYGQILKTRKNQTDFAPFVVVKQHCFMGHNILTEIE